MRKTEILTGILVFLFLIVRSENCTICYTITNIGNETALACHNTWMCGDVNGDRTVNVVDALHVYRRALDPSYDFNCCLL